MRKVFQYLHTIYNGSVLFDVNSTSVNALYDCCELSELMLNCGRFRATSIVRAIEITYCKCRNEIDDLIDVKQWEKPIK
jgi:hypothetical protein